MKLSKKIAISIMALYVLLCSEVKAQADQLSDLLQLGSDDASKLMGAYVKPAAKSIGFGSNGGWYNTAKAHKTLGFDLTVSMSGAMVSDADKVFDVESLGLNEDITASPTTSPTIFGSDNPDNATELTLGSIMLPNENGDQVNVAPKFKAPTGANLSGNFIPVPIVQLGIGIVKNTDIKIRYVPEIEFKDFNMRSYGFGVMHDIKQWIPVVKALPFDMSALVAYQRTDFSVGINSADENQKASLGVNSMTYQLLLSKKLAMFTFYGGAGYSNANTTLKLSGDYVIESNSAEGSETVSLKFTDPVDLNISSSGTRATLGMRLKILIMTFHCDYTFQEYNMFNAGVGVAFR